MEQLLSEFEYSLLVLIRAITYVLSRATLLVVHE